MNWIKPQLSQMQKPTGFVNPKAWMKKAHGVNRFLSIPKSKGLHICVQLQIFHVPRHIIECLTCHTIQNLDGAVNITITFQEYEVDNS